MILRIFNAFFHAAVFVALFVGIITVAQDRSSDAFSVIMAFVFFESFVVGSFIASDAYFKTHK